MKTNYVLIDYENVQPVMADVLAAELFKVIVFVGASQAKVNFDVVSALQRKGSAAQYVKISGNGRNALDFHIAYYIGQLSTNEPNAYFHVISADKGMDPLIEHLRGKGLRVSRSEEIQAIPISMVTDSAPVDDKLSAVIAFLISRGVQRPASMKTLSGSVAALFNPKLADAEVASLLSQLEAQGVFAMAGNKLQYALPD